MWRKILFVGLVLAAVFVFTGCIGGGGPTIVDRTIAWITGFVTKFRGEPIQNARVTLKESGDGAVTDSSGRFRFGTRYRGEGTLRAEADGYLPLEWPVTVTDDGVSITLKLVTMSDYDPSLFRTLTAITDTQGTMRWPDGVIRYYVDRSGPWRPEFDTWLRDAFTEWSMATRRAIVFAEGDSSSPLKIRFVNSSPCGYSNAAGCGGPTSLGPGGEITGAIIELATPYADQKVVVHEVGHILSLYGHSPNPQDVMYPGGSLRPTTPSNAEAAVAAVLYTNPPGTTAGNIRLPAADGLPFTVTLSDSPVDATYPREPVHDVREESPGGSGWWSDILCRFAILAPLCGDSWTWTAVGF